MTTTGGKLGEQNRGNTLKNRPPTEPQTLHLMLHSRTWSWSWFRPCLNQNPSSCRVMGYIWFLPGQPGPGFCLCPGPVLNHDLGPLLLGLGSGLSVSVYSGPGLSSGPGFLKHSAAVKL